MLFMLFNGNPARKAWHNIYDAGNCRSFDLRLARKRASRGAQDERVKE